MIVSEMDIGIHKNIFAERIIFNVKQMLYCIRFKMKL